MAIFPAPKTIPVTLVGCDKVADANGTTIAITPKTIPVTLVGCNSGPTNAGQWNTALTPKTIPVTLVGCNRR